jgi:hypothetical protein
MRKGSKRRIGLHSLLLLGAIAGFLGIRWATVARLPLPEAIEVLDSDDQVTVTYQSWLTFSPSPATHDTGLIFCPGGRIDPWG